MRGEYGEIAYFDSANDQLFREALVGRLIVPAYAKALDINQETGGEFIFVDEEVQGDDSRSVYDFYARPGEETITIQAGVFVVIEELSQEAVGLLQQMVHDSDLPLELKQKYSIEDMLRLPGVVEQFIEQSFEINIRSGEVLVRTDLGFAVGGNVIDEEEESARPITDLDQKREAIFESRELVELVRALYAMELITQDEVRDFLNAF
ncbi:MAG TPA: hypothetical protein VL481_02670 [Verrucomicrobiae bacterium]|nr:hypothetical protein [Verrucomicrobiae bacterium]